MKNIIINILIFIITFNVIMIIFPEGKTQKFCKLTIKLLIMIYIINSLFMNKFLSLDNLSVAMPGINNYYERQINIKNIDKEFIEKINNDLCHGEKIIDEITLQFADDMSINAVISLNNMLNTEEADKLKKEIAEIFKMDIKNIKIDL